MADNYGNWDVNPGTVVFIFFLIFIPLLIIGITMLLKNSNNNVNMKNRIVKSDRQWTQEEIMSMYNLIINGPDSDFMGCVDFARCYTSQLQMITSYDNVINHWDDIPDSIRDMVSDAKYSCMLMYPCHNRNPVKSKSNKKKLLKY